MGPLRAAKERAQSMERRDGPGGGSGRAVRRAAQAESAALILPPARDQLSFEWQSNYPTIGVEDVRRKDGSADAAGADAAWRRGNADAGRRGREAQELEGHDARGGEFGVRMRRAECAPRRRQSARASCKAR